MIMLIIASMDPDVMERIASIILAMENNVDDGYVAHNGDDNQNQINQ